MFIWRATTRDYNQASSTMRRHARKREEAAPLVGAGRVATLLTGAALLLAGCGQPAGEIFEPPEAALVWPAPPEPARVHYVGSLVTSEDLKPARSFGAALGEALFGREEARSMLTPYALCRDEGDRLFVCDSNAQVIHVFDLDRRDYEQWSPPDGWASFAQPVGVALDWRDRLLVSDSVAGTIFVFDRSGAFLGELGAEHLQRPCGIAVDEEAQRIYVADVATHQVVVLDGDGGLTQRVGTRGTALGEFNYPTNVAVDGSGRLYVSDSLNFRVQLFARELTPVRQIGRKGDLPGYFSHPKGIAVDGEDHLYVLDAHFESVQIFDPEGALLLAFGSEGGGPGEFWLPTGICIDRNNRIWIADSYNRRVQVFDYRAEVLP
jgi:DNA-binding beta-propeller fold protein YncE